MAFWRSWHVPKPYKPELARSIKRLSEIDIIGEKFSLTCTYVLDGCVLFHRIPWEKKGTYSEILDGYWNYVSAKYLDAIIVFDGYNIAASTKDVTHLKRNLVTEREALFSPEMKLTPKKEEFLLCKKNKARFVNLLSDYLRGKGLKTIQAKADADLLIVLTAVECSKTWDTVVIGDNTDLFVLLLYHL